MDAGDPTSILGKQKRKRYVDQGESSRLTKFKSTCGECMYACSFIMSILGPVDHELALLVYF